jgi:type I restriction enzyme, S subunit
MYMKDPGPSSSRRPPSSSKVIVPLKTVCVSLAACQCRGRKEGHFWGGNVNWVSSGEVAFCRIDKTAERITDDGLVSASTRVHPPGTVLLGMIGEGKTRGQAAILSVPACNNQNCAAIRVSEAHFSPLYVYWYLYFSYEKTRNAGAGNNQPALKDRVQRILFPLAPPAEAEVIAARIEKAFEWLDRIVAERNNASRLLPKLNQAILAKAFRGELVPQDINDKRVPYAH